MTRNGFKACTTKSYVNEQEVNRIIKNIDVGVEIKKEKDICIDKNSIDSELENCKKCDKLRFKRSHHCSICNLCTDKMDHHCFILNNCIGRKNYHYFISYLYLVTFNALFVTILCVITIYRYKDDSQKNDNVFIILMNFPLRAFILVIISTVTFILVGYFFIYNMKLILYDRTSIEAKYFYKNGDKSNKYEIKQKFITLHKNLLILLNSNTIFDLYWPD